MARLLGLKDPKWISHWESGHALPNLVSAIRPSFIYEVQIGDLFSGSASVLREESGNAAPLQERKDEEMSSSHAPEDIP